MKGGGGQTDVSFSLFVLAFVLLKCALFASSVSKTKKYPQEGTGVSGREGKKKGQDQGKEGKKVKRRAPEAFGGERVWWSKSRDEPRVV